MKFKIGFVSLVVGLSGCKSEPTLESMASSVFHRSLVTDTDLPAIDGVNAIILDGGYGFSPNGYWDLNDVIELHEGEDLCVYINGWKFVESNLEGNTIYYLKTDPVNPECESMLRIAYQGNKK
jgi:hypothetical protein